MEESIRSAAGVLLVNNLNNYTQGGELGDPARAVSILNLGALRNSSMEAQ